MTSPARTQPGPLGAFAFGAGGTVEFRDFRPHPQAIKAVFQIRIDQPGDMTVDRVSGGEASQLVPIVPLVVTDDEETIIVDFPVLGDIRLTFTNTNATAGSIRVDATFSGQSSAGRGSL